MRLTLLASLLTCWSGGCWALLREGDNYAVGCDSPGWKYCSWKHQVSTAGAAGDELSYS